MLLSDKPLEKGIPPHRARLTVARSIVATLYGMWKSGGEYDPDIKEKSASKKETNRFEQPIVLKLVRQKSVSDGTRKRESITNEVAYKVILFTEYTPSQFPQIFIGVRASERCVRQT